ncbi:MULTISPECIES: VanZ family protein [unclassified Salinibacterium]|uniref:VanZ family protein n=1 Tax=unclassified Salinibacterium TaxID=2632331 RepID=UPI00141F4608|nr:MULTISPECIES: VanZ family protein [unclassified Salinibacterium]
MDRFTPGLLALGVGFVAAFALLIPFIAVSYRRRGGLTPGRTVAWLALLLWVLGMWAYTLLPLPDDGYRCAGVVLDPLQGFRDVLTDGRAAVEQLVLNVALFVPWGFLVRALWRRGWLVATASGLVLSLGVEFTQLTGVWGALPCAYRFFDTGDLLTNTAGALLGSLVAIPFLRRAPRRPSAADRIALSRRLVGMACDAIVAWTTASVVTTAANAVQVYLWEVERTAIDYTLSAWVGGITAFVMIGALVVATGTSPGESAVNIAGVDAPRAVVVRRTVRYLAGIGGFQLVSALPEGWGSLTAFGFIVASLVVAWRTPQHRGLASSIAGMDIRLGGAPSSADEPQLASQSPR